MPSFTRSVVRGRASLQHGQQIREKNSDEQVNLSVHSTISDIVTTCYNLSSEVETESSGESVSTNCWIVNGINQCSRGCSLDNTIDLLLKISNKSNKISHFDEMEENSTEIRSPRQRPRSKISRLFKEIVQMNKIELILKWSF